MKMKITPKKVKKILIVIGAILVVLYTWEYYCTTRPIGQCGSLCQDRSYITGHFRNQTLYGHTCNPWYRWFLK